MSCSPFFFDGVAAVSESPRAELKPEYFKQMRRQKLVFSLASRGRAERSPSPPTGSLRMTPVARLGKGSYLGQLSHLGKESQLKKGSYLSKESHLGQVSQTGKRSQLKKESQITQEGEAEAEEKAGKVAKVGRLNRGSRIVQTRFPRPEGRVSLGGSNCESEVMANLEKFFRIRKTPQLLVPASDISRELSYRISEMERESDRSSREVIARIRAQGREISRLVLPAKRAARLRLWKKLKAFTIYLKRAGFDAAMVMRLPCRPFSLPESKTFLSACKSDDLARASLLLRDNWMLVFEFDEMRRSGLHWAVDNNCELVTMLLIKSGAFLDSTDYLDRPPLFFALRNGNKNLTLALLNAGASPWSPQTCELLDAPREFPHLVNLLKRFRFASLSLKVFGKKRSPFDQLNVSIPF